MSGSHPYAVVAPRQKTFDDDNKINKEEEEEEEGMMVMNVMMGSGYSCGRVSKGACSIYILS